MHTVIYSATAARMTLQLTLTASWVLFYIMTAFDHRCTNLRIQVDLFSDKAQNSDPGTLIFQMCGSEDPLYIVPESFIFWAARRSVCLYQDQAMWAIIARCYSLPNVLEACIYLHYHFHFFRVPCLHACLNILFMLLHSVFSIYKMDHISFFFWNNMSQILHL